MSKETFTSIEQIKRDMELGTFPAKSEATKREDVLSSRVYELSTETLTKGAPGLSPTMCAALARSITMKVMNEVRKSNDPDMPDLSLCSFNYLAEALRKRGATVTPAPHGGDFAER